MDSARPSDPILVVDDEPRVLSSIQRTLRSQGLPKALTCGDSRDVIRILEEHRVSLVLLDLLMPHVHGEEILGRVVKAFPELPVIVVTAEHDLRTAVRCMKLGATDYLVKPVDRDCLVEAVVRSLEQSALRFECTRLREQFFSEQLECPESFAEIVTCDPSMFRVFAYLEAISQGSHPVFISGETGTGKELIAKALHRASNRDGPFIAVSVSGLDDAMFADTLFGHRRGAFTGAGDHRDGMIKRSGEGTLFLDEIGDLSEASQVKLLRVLQEREYYPLGSDSPEFLRARIVAATHKDPSALRQDLYYRLRSYHIRVPPLRERLRDLPPLVDHFLVSAAQDLGKPKPTVPEELFVNLSNYDFPGNIRELQSMVFDAVARHEHGVMPLQLFLNQIRTDASRESTSSAGDIEFPFPLPTMRQIEQAVVAEALKQVQGNQSAAARILGVSRPTIGRYLSRIQKDYSDG